MSVKVALAGVGNCVSSLVQGVEYYRGAADDEQVPGLMHVRLGGYHDATRAGTMCWRSKPGSPRCNGRARGAAIATSPIIRNRAPR